MSTGFDQGSLNLLVDLGIKKRLRLRPGRFTNTPLVRPLLRRACRLWCPRHGDRSKGFPTAVRNDQGFMGFVGACGRLIVAWALHVARMRRRWKT